MAGRSVGDIRRGSFTCLPSWPRTGHCETPLWIDVLKTWRTRDAATAVNRCSRCWAGRRWYQRLFGCKNGMLPERRTSNSRAWRKVEHQDQRVDGSRSAAHGIGGHVRTDHALRRALPAAGMRRDDDGDHGYRHRRDRVRQPFQKVHLDLDGFHGYRHFLYGRDGRADGKTIAQKGSYDDPMEGPITLRAVTKMVESNTEMLRCTAPAGGGRKRRCWR